MSKFFVGQLVRVVGATSFPELIGEECLVTAVDVESQENLTGRKVFVVIRTDLKPTRGLAEWADFYPEHLEPILYDGAQPIAESFEEMMGKLREGVVA